MSPEIFGAFALFPCFLIIFAIAMAIASLVLWIWALVDCAQNEPSEGNDKVVWILVIVLTHALGAVLYLLIRRPQRIRQYGK